MRDGEERTITSSSGSRYQVKCVGGIYSCSCPGWRNQHRDPKYRTCKHLIDFRGARDEANRIFPGGTSGNPSTVDRALAGLWPASGAGRAFDHATGRTPEPASVVARGEMLAGRPAPGGRSVPYRPETTVRFPAAKGKPAKAPSEPPKHNAWTALLDDDHPLAEPLPPTPPAANDTADVKAASDDEPEWVGSSEPIDPARVVAAATAAPVASAASFRGVLLAESWDGVQNITGWLMSEKLDGVRAYWDGERFFSRNGNVFSVPDWYREKMPKGVHLDGEFWMGRGLFQKTSGYVRRLDKGEYWREINYMIFDVPSVDAGFEDRIGRLGKDIALPAHAKLLPHAACPGIDVLRTYLEAVEEQGGEGVMLRQPGSRYVRTRSATLLKVKTFFDTEVEVTGTTAGKGRHVGVVGALEVICRETIELRAGKKTCILRGGTRFEVGTGLSDYQRRPGVIPVGSIITCRFQELSTDGIPRFPSLVGVRNYE
jgi:DNA ligase-1